MALPEHLQAQHKQQPSAEHLVVHAVLPQAEHNWQITLTYTSLEASEPVYPVDSLRLY